MSRARDPGWRPALRGGVLGVFPVIGPRQVLRATNTLILMRQLWMTFVTAMVVLAIPVWFLWSLLGSAGIDGRLVAAVVVAAGVATQVVAPGFLPPVEGRTEREVRHSVHRRFFIRVALAESVALLAFLGVLLSGNAAVYLAGLVIGVIGLAEIAPTAAWLARTQADLRDAGSTVDLLQALSRGGMG